MKLFISALLSSTAVLSNAFVLPQGKISSHTQLKMAVVTPSESSTVGIVGRGYISVVTAKLAALAGYNTWMLCPPGQEETIASLIGDDSLNLEFIDATDADRLSTRLSNTDAFIVAVDDDSTMDEGVLNYVLNRETSPNVKRVVAMSRNLNGKDMGFFVKASKISANKEVWDNSKSADYKKFEDVIKRQTAAVGGEYTIVRVGTLKGGACGEEPLLKQYLSSKVCSICCFPPQFILFTFDFPKSKFHPNRTLVLRNDKEGHHHLAAFV